MPKVYAVLLHIDEKPANRAECSVRKCHAGQRDGYHPRAYGQRLRRVSSTMPTASAIRASAARTLCLRFWGKPASRSP